MHKFRDFQLVLRADGVGHLREGVVRVLERIVATEQVEGWLDGHSLHPIVTSSPWGSFRSISEAFEHLPCPSGKRVKAWAELWY
jgi:hypothetical protein